MNTDLIVIKKIINNDYRTTQEYQALIEECKAIITEAVFTSRWALVEGYWNLGKRIREDDNVKEFAKGSKTFVQDLAQILNIADRTIYYALQAYDTYPDLSKMPEGKNISWNKLITKYLPRPKENKVTIPLPDGEFDVVYADIPWRYEFSETESRSIESKYPTMEVEEIEQIQVPSASNAVLFLWATAPKLREALKVMESWGFTYRTCCVWDKEIIGMGYWFRNQHELLLVGIKGNFSPPEESVRESSVYLEKRTIHSKKPDYYYSLIERLCPNGKYLELFARQKRQNWNCWGDEIDQQVSCEKNLCSAKNKPN